MDLHGYLGVMCFCDENDSLAKLCVTTDSFLRPTFLTFDELLTLEGDQQTHYRSARGFSLCPPPASILTYGKGESGIILVDVAK